MIEQARLNERDRLAAGRPASSASAAAAAAAGQGDEGYWAYMQRQMNERMENLSTMGDGMQNLQENSAGWADDVSKFVSKQKRGLVLGAVKGRFGL